MKIPTKAIEILRDQGDKSAAIEWLLAEARTARSQGLGELSARLYTAAGRVRQGQWDKALEGLTA